MTRPAGPQAARAGVGVKVTGSARRPRSTPPPVHRSSSSRAATDQVICLNTHICCAGHPETVTRHPEYRALFGSAAERLAVYVHHHDHAHALAGEVLPIEGAAEHRHEHP